MRNSMSKAILARLMALAMAAAVVPDRRSISLRFSRRRLRRRLPGGMGGLHGGGFGGFHPGFGGFHSRDSGGFHPGFGGFHPAFGSEFIGFHPPLRRPSLLLSSWLQAQWILGSTAGGVRRSPSAW